MASAAAYPVSYVKLDPIEHIIVTSGLMMAVLLGILDTTIANVALPHMMSSMSATQETITWVLTSYIVASAIAIPITGWLSDRVGRKRLFIGSVVAFTAASMLCAIAQNLPEMVLFRVFQGIAAAFLSPIAQAVMLDINPPERHGKSMGVFGAVIMIGPILGPVLGGWLTESFNWRWVFLVNVPIGIISILMLVRFLPKTELRRRRFDLFGFTLLGITLGSLQMMLDRGQQLDWFQSWEIWIEAGLVISCGWMFVVHLFTAREPVFDPHLFADRNFNIAIFVMGASALLMYGVLALLPPLLQHLLGYSVLHSGFLTAPRGITTVVSMIVAGRLTTKVDIRIMMLFGMFVLGFSLWLMTGFSLEMDSTPVVISGLVQGLGLGFIFVPLQPLAFGMLPPHLRTTGASLFNLSRTLGGSLGISMVTILLARNLQVSHSDLASQITPYTLATAGSWMAERMGRAGDRAAALIDLEVTRQALMIAYLDNFHLMMLLTGLGMLLVFLLRKPRPGGDAPLPIAAD